jgi:hypothetical protein
MRVPHKTELAPAKLAPQQQDRCGGNYHQRHQLLPIHAGNIISNEPGATNHCARAYPYFLPCAWQDLRTRICRAGSVHSNAQLSGCRTCVGCKQIVATKDHKQFAKGLIQGLELRVHVGPPVREAEVLSAREFLRQNDFSLASDYFHRLAQIQNRLEARVSAPAMPPAKRNYGGQAAGRWMQLQSAYDHVILSTCYEGEFDFKQGKVKISHRFNQQGRIDFVELKFLRSLQPCLNGEIRSLLRVRD